MRQRRGLRALRTVSAWLVASAMAGMCVLWIVTVWCGFYMRQGLSTVHLEDGAVSYWHASTYFTNYARDDSWKFYPVKLNDLNSYVPLFTQTPGRFDVIARVPFWMPVLLLAPVAAILWRYEWRDRRRARTGLCGACGYNRSGLAADAKCPECGTVPGKSPSL